MIEMIEMIEMNEKIVFWNYWKYNFTKGIFEEHKSYNKFKMTSLGASNNNCTN